MLLFRSEEHVDRWCGQWQLTRGAVFDTATAWRLAVAWYARDRRDPGWRRFTTEEATAVLAQIGLTSDFWRLS